MRVFVGKWCVYGHYVDGKCIYIGMGRPSRAFGNAPTRSQQWSDLVKDGYDVQILSWHETQSECLAREIDAIREVKPVCNKMHNGWVPEAFRKNWRPGRRSPHSDELKARMSDGQRKSWARGRKRIPCNHRVAVRCIETGEVFPSMSHAAASVGASVAAISKSIAKRGSTAGYTFVKEVP